MPAESTKIARLEAEIAEMSASFKEQFEVIKTELKQQLSLRDKKISEMAEAINILELLVDTKKSKKYVETAKKEMLQLHKRTRDLIDVTSVATEVAFWGRNQKQKSIRSLCNEAAIWVLEQPAEIISEKGWADKVLKNAAKEVMDCYLEFKGAING